MNIIIGAERVSRLRCESGGGEGRAERNKAEKHDCGRLLGEHAKSKSGFRLVRTEE